MVRGVEDFAYAAGYSVVLCDADDDPAKESAYLERELAEDVGGVILALSGADVDVADFVDRGVPMVSAGRALAARRLDRVLIDDAAGAELAVAHLLEEGYSRIGWLAGTEDCTTLVELYHGYRHGLESSGTGFDESLVKTTNSSEDGGYRAMRDLLGSPGRPDAVVVTSSRMALGAWRAVSERGLQVPGDMGIIGFDDTSWAVVRRPSLTVIVRPYYHQGVEAARLLLKRIRTGGEGPTVVTLVPSLSVRRSSVPK